MAIFTREQLRSYQKDTADFTTDRSFELVNNAGTTAYFNIEGVGGKTVFQSASLTSLVSCSVVSHSVMAAFIINPNSTASFTFGDLGGTTIKKEDVRFVATNALRINSTGSVLTTEAFGVDLDTNA